LVAKPSPQGRPSGTSPAVAITDDFMQEMLSKRRPYTVVILLRTSKRDAPGADKIVWKHGRRNFELRRDGKVSIICPINTTEAVSGLCIFSTDLAETRRIMDDDPAVKAGVFTYEVYSTRSFPGDSLAA